MDKVIELLTDKNMHLEKFRKLNEIEIHNFSDGNFDNLENFYNTRESLLNLIHKIDEIVDDLNAEPESPAEISAEHKIQILHALDKKNTLVTEILTQDLQILSLIEGVKSDIIRELAQVRSTKKALSSYKSGMTDKQLDEEA